MLSGRFGGYGFVYIVNAVTYITLSYNFRSQYKNTNTLNGHTGATATSVCSYFYIHLSFVYIYICLVRLEWDEMI